MKADKLLLCLDLSEVDIYVVKYGIRFIERVHPTAEVVLFHNIRHDFLDEYPLFYQEQIEGLKAKVAKKIDEKFGKHFREEGISYSVEVRDLYSTASAIQEALKELNIDLLLMGKKDRLKGAGIIPQKVLAGDKGRTPLLLVPEDLKRSSENLLGAIDLSPSSARILQVTNELAKRFHSHATCLYVYQVPTSYFPYIELDNQEIYKEMRSWAEKKFNQFVKGLKTGLTAGDNLKLVKGANVPATILEYVEAKKLGLIVLNRIARTDLFGNRVGSVSRKLLVTRKLQVPILIL